MRLMLTNFSLALLLFLWIALVESAPTRQSDYNRDLFMQILHSEDLFITVKTTGRYQNSRLPEILRTWFLKAPNQTYFVTDEISDEWVDKLHKHVFPTRCAPDHTRSALACKMQHEIELWMIGNSKWSCHFDDDNYVNIENLKKFLSSFNENESYFFGKKSMQPKFEILNEVGEYESFDFATGGAGFCVSNGALNRIQEFHKAGGPNAFENLSRRNGVPDDVTFGLMMTRIGVPMINIIDFHSHLEDDQEIRQIVNNAISLPLVYY